MSKTNKIKILHAIRQGKVGGGETHVLDLVNELNKIRFESVILAFTDGPMIDKLKADGFKTYVIHTEMPFNFQVWKAVQQIISSENIDIIHAHGTRANSNVFSSSKALKIPLIYTVHGWSFHPDQHFIVKMIRTLSERFLVSVASKTICVSESNLNEGKKSFPMTRATVVVNGINQVKFNPDNIYPNIRTEFGISDTVVLVGYIARITAQKDPLSFIRAIAKIENNLDVKFLIVGEGDLKTKMLELAEELHILERVIFVDFRSDIPALLAAMDIFCLPSLWEGLPIALLEAMAMKKAIIATSIDGTRDLIKHMINGILVPTSSPEKLAEAITLLLANPSLRMKLGDAAAFTVSQQFEIKTMTKKIESIYEAEIQKPLM